MNKTDYMIGHESYLGPRVGVKRITELRPGDVIQCNYKGENRYFFVLNALMDKVHCLSLRDIPRHALLVDVIAHMDTAKSPHDFYYGVLTSDKVKQWDCYRTLNKPSITGMKKMLYILDAKAMVPDKDDNVSTPITTKDLKKS